MDPLRRPAAAYSADIFGFEMQGQFLVVDDDHNHHDDDYDHHNHHDTRGDRRRDQVQASQGCLSGRGP